MKRQGVTAGPAGFLYGVTGAFMLYYMWLQYRSIPHRQWNPPGCCRGSVSIVQIAYLLSVVHCALCVACSVCRNVSGSEATDAGSGGSSNKPDASWSPDGPDLMQQLDAVNCEEV